MNERRIAIIVQMADDGNDFFAALRLVQIPQGYQADIITVDNSTGRAAAYQEAMTRSDAKYKIYMDESARILKADFFTLLLEIFQADAAVGVIGTSGTKGFLSDGWYENAHDRVGRCCLGSNFQEKIWGQDCPIKQEVQAADEFLIATQYDIPWRTDLFPAGTSYVVTAHCLDFRRKGYKVIVPRQNSAWAADMAEKRQPENANQETFLDEYSKDILPLVSVVIPTYNRPHYFSLALDSVLQQTYRNLDIFVTDDSTNDETYKLMERYLAANPCISYEHHHNWTAADNWYNAASYDNPKAEYVNWLMDDDVFLPAKISRMVDAYLLYPQVSLVTSYRQLIDENGCVIPDFISTQPLCEKTTIFSGESIGKYMLQTRMNYVGEPTTALMKKSLLQNCFFGTWGGQAKEGTLYEFPTWCYMLTKGNLMYIREPLSQFRIHGENGTWNVANEMRAYALWSQMIKLAWQKKVFFADNTEYLQALRDWQDFIMGTLPGLYSKLERLSESENNFLTAQGLMEKLLYEIDENANRLNML